MAECNVFNPGEAAFMTTMTVRMSPEDAALVRKFAASKA